MKRAECQEYVKEYIELKIKGILLVVIAIALFLLLIYARLDESLVPIITLIGYMACATVIVFAALFGLFYIYVGKE